MHKKHQNRGCSSKTYRDPSKAPSVLKPCRRPCSHLRVQYSSLRCNLSLEPGSDPSPDQSPDQIRVRRYNRAADAHPGILSRWSWRRVLQFSGGIGLEPRQRCVYTRQERFVITANNPPPPCDAVPLEARCFTATLLSKTRSQAALKEGPDLETAS